MNQDDENDDPFLWKNVFECNQRNSPPGVKNLLIASARSFILAL
eukprot:CAMPEP_0185252492 /NCGR_PEP_ID=MMETSP1359-20130426/1563_1 /TAXON_ID=552665 /ORGANISM="Bigelowiella longifila, Strain CCMP242" /LENGTH=43 /DNA_ID= /DNA_START= /DNA_END= /DNA_ORIENTATION=